MRHLASENTMNKGLPAQLRVKINQSIKINHLKALSNAVFLRA
jgi:hypothetical protein